MKKLFNLALFGAIALTGAVGFSSCSSSSDEVINNPDYNPETNSVKVQIAISLQENIAGTRMSDVNTQASGAISGFKGMKNIVIVPYNVSAVTNSTPILESKLIGLSDIAASTTGNATEANKVYSDVTVPMTTNRFLFYGNAGLTEGFDNGALTVSGLSTTGSTSDVSGVTFTPVSIYNQATSDIQTTQDRKKNNILQLLNRVAESSINNGTKTITWAPGENVIANPQLALLHPLFMRTTAGGSIYVQKLLETLYNNVNALATDGTSSDAHNLAVAIQNNIKDALSYTDVNTINCAANTVTLNNTTNKYELTLSSDYTNYPTDLNLPAGSARIMVDATTGKFVDVASPTPGGTDSNVTPFTSYSYPANLQYFVETDIITADQKVLGENGYTFTQAQAAYNASGVAKGTSVIPTTRSILLNKQIQYGVGRLETIVNALDGSATYYDHDGTAITIPTTGYTLTGILIGDQRPVDWHFAKITTGNPYTIYDNKIAGTTSGSAVTTSSASAVNHTLALESIDDASVKVALEFVNNGGEFKGHDGIIIPAGATFYLVGNLTPSSTDTNYGTDAGKTQKVFAQDFVTKATFTIRTGAGTSGWGGTPMGLGEAYIGLPDLTMPQMELGLSVDLQWQSGLTISVDL